VAIALETAEKVVGGGPQAISAAVIGPDGDAMARLGDLLAEDLAEMPVAISATLSDLSPSGPVPSADVYVAACDLSRKDSLGEIEALASSLSAPLVLVVEGEVTARETKAVLRAGIAGLVRWNKADTSLAATVRAVGGGQLAIPRELGLQIEKPALSRRQKQVLGLVVMGLSNGEIATQLHLSEHTVKCHLYASFRKLGVNSRDEAVSKILDPSEGLGTGILAISDRDASVGKPTPDPTN
jgi:DNA-binding NarL/FixJ family response regulator